MGCCEIGGQNALANKIWAFNIVKAYLPLEGCNSKRSGFVSKNNSPFYNDVSPRFHHDVFCHARFFGFVAPLFQLRLVSD